MRFFISSVAALFCFCSISEAKYQEWPKKLVCTGSNLVVKIAPPDFKAVNGVVIASPGSMIVNGGGFGLPTRLHRRDKTNLEVMRKDGFACWLFKQDATMTGGCGQWSPKGSTAAGTAVTCL